jgi:hypothetical protein
VRRLRPFLWAPLLWASLLAGSGPALAGEEARLSWIYVEANTGGSSGGHVALRVGETIYHIQQSPHGLYELHRDEWETFRHVYAGLQNRTLAVAELDVSAADLERVQMRLAKAYVAQRAELEQRERRALDVAWLEAWRAGRTPPPLAGAGLLAPGAAADPHAEALRDQVRSVVGESFLDAERARVAAQLADFAPGEDELEALRETLQLHTALLALDEAWGVSEGALLPLDGVLAEPLSKAERSGSLRFAEAQRDSVIELLRSARPDRGHALLLALARHQVLARSSGSGQLVLLDAYAGEGDFLPASEHPEPATLARLEGDLGPVLRSGRTKVLTRRDFDEMQYNLLEVGAGIWREYQRGARGERIRKLPRHALPAAARALGFAPARADAAQLAAAHDTAQGAYQQQDERVRSLYRYSVLKHNCVTELARLLNDAFAPDEVSRALGARLEPGAGFGFIPFAFFDEALHRLRVESVEPVASHRKRELARLLREDAGLGRRLREAVTWSSSIYTPRLRDSSFLFFTDDVFWRRPLLGLANLGYATGSGVLGLLTAPFDGARRLRAAGTGAWYSLPELAFFNIRKGTFEYVPSEAE